MLTLFCVVVGEGRPFPVEIDGDKTIGILKDKIKEKKEYKFPADELQLYRVDGLAQDENEQFLHNEITIDMPNCSLDDFGSKKKLATTFRLSSYPQLNDTSVGRIHVLVVVPEGAAKKGEWSAKELSTIDPQVQWKLWKSVVRITIEDSSGPIDSSTALVVDRTSNHLYVLTNLHLFLGELFCDALSPEFKKQIKLYSKLHPGKKSNAKRKNESASDSGPSIRRSKCKKAPDSYGIFQIAIEQLFPDEEALKEVNKCSLKSDICWECSATFDFAILEIPTPPNAQLELVPCEMAFGVFATMPVHVFGFPGNLEAGKFDHQYAIIPAEVTGTNRNQMTLSTLSAPGLSGSAIVCTKRGIPIGYLGGGFDGTSKNEQYQSYGFTLQGIPSYLPSALSSQDEESKQEDS
ncbi:unnamed protein product [Aphanomyces euteiches]